MGSVGGRLARARHQGGHGIDHLGRHRTVDEVIQMLEDTNAQKCNLLLNTGPLPDGSLHPDDVRTLRAVGQRLRN